MNALLSADMPEATRDEDVSHVLVADSAADPTSASPLKAQATKPTAIPAVNSPGKNKKKRPRSTSPSEPQESPGGARDECSILQSPKKKSKLQEGGGPVGEDGDGDGDGDVDVKGDGDGKLGRRKKDGKVKEGSSSQGDRPPISSLPQDTVAPTTTSLTPSSSGTTTSVRDRSPLETVEVGSSRTSAQEEDEEMVEAKAEAEAEAEARANAKKDKGKGRLRESSVGDGEREGSAEARARASASEMQDLRKELERLRKEMGHKNEMLASQTASISGIHSSMSCNICLETLDNPFALDCGHVFCHKDIWEWFHRRPENQANDNNARAPHAAYVPQPRREIQLVDRRANVERMRQRRVEQGRAPPPPEPDEADRGIIEEVIYEPVAGPSNENRRGGVNNPVIISDSPPPPPVFPDSPPLPPRRQLEGQRGGPFPHPLYQHLMNRGHHHHHHHPEDRERRPRIPGANLVCPQCRARVLNAPRAIFVLRELLDAVKKTLPNEGDEEPQETLSAEEEAKKKEKEADKTWGGIFSIRNGRLRSQHQMWGDLDLEDDGMVSDWDDFFDAITVGGTDDDLDMMDESESDGDSQDGEELRPVRDVEDGVLRCPYCHWEVEHGFCEGCGRTWDLPLGFEDGHEDMGESEDDDDGAEEEEEEEDADSFIVDSDEDAEAEAGAMAAAGADDVSDDPNDGLSRIRGAARPGRPNRRRPHAIRISSSEDEGEEEEEERVDINDGEEADEAAINDDESNSENSQDSGSEDGSDSAPEEVSTVRRLRNELRRGSLRARRQAEMEQEGEGHVVNNPAARPSTSRRQAAVRGGAVRDLGRQGIDYDYDSADDLDFETPSGLGEDEDDEDGDSAEEQDGIYYNDENEGGNVDDDREEEAGTAQATHPRRSRRIVGSSDEE